MADLNGHFGLLGFGIIGIFVVAWVISVMVYRISRLEELELAQLHD
jgi:high-affinity nickel-transport protein